MNYQTLVSALSASTQTSVLIIHDIMLNLIQILFINSVQRFCHINEAIGSFFIVSTD